jgi:hypothetical protein
MIIWSHVEDRDVLCPRMIIDSEYNNIAFLVHSCTIPMSFSHGSCHIKRDLSASLDAIYLVTRFGNQQKYLPTHYMSKKAPKARTATMTRRHITYRNLLYTPRLPFVRTTRSFLSLFFQLLLQHIRKSKVNYEVCYFDQRNCFVCHSGFGLG